MRLDSYEALALRGEATLTRDEKLSLLYFLTYMELRQNPLAFPDSRDRVVLWVRRALEVEAALIRDSRFPVENNRRPASAETRSEHVLSSWDRYERKSETRARRCGFQREWLMNLPSNRMINRKRRWAMRRRMYSAFLVRCGRAPRYRSEDPREKSLAAWAAKQRMQYQAERLSAKQVASLERLASWSWGKRGVQSPQYEARIRVLAWGEPRPIVDLSQMVIVVPVPDPQARGERT